MAQARLNSQNKKGGKGKTVIIILLLLIIAAALIWYFFFRNKNTAPEEPAEALDRGVITEDNVDDIISQMEEAGPLDTSYYHTTMNTEWHFENGEAASYDAYVENSEKNKTPVYFDLFLADDEENAIYKSPVIPVGKVLEKFKLEKDLDPGTYDCVMVYHLVDDDQNTLSTVRVSCTVVIEG